MLTPTTETPLDRKRARSRRYQQRKRAALPRLPTVPKPRQSEALQGLASWMATRRRIFGEQLDHHVTAALDELTVHALLRQPGVVDDCASGFELRR